MIGKEIFEKHVLSGDKRFEALGPAQLSRLYEAWSREAAGGVEPDKLLDVQHIYVLAIRAGILNAPPENIKTNINKKKTVKKEDVRMKEFKMGTLAGKPKLNVVKVNGKDREVCNATIFIYDKTAPENENGFKYGIPVAITAWGEKANELEGFAKGDIIGVFGQPKAEVYENNDGVKVRYGLTVSSVYDATEAMKINKQMNQILSAYEKGDIEMIYAGPEKEEKAEEPAMEEKTAKPKTKAAPSKKEEKVAEPEKQEEEER